MFPSRNRLRPQYDDQRARLVDERCDQYEADWKTSHPRKIGDYLGDVAGELRTALWLELVLLDQELRRNEGERPTLADYRESCPDAMILLDLSTAGPVSDPLRDDPTWAVEPKDRDRERNPEPMAARAGLARMAEPRGPSDDPSAATEVIDSSDAMTGPIELPETAGPEVDAAVLARAGDDRALGEGIGCLGDYALQEKLGAGGMGVVFKARQTRLDRDVALKIIKPDALTQEMARLFQIEALAVAALDHPHIVPVLESGEHQGVLYYSMKLIDGQTLDQCRGRFRDQPRAIARLMVPIAEAIHHAHQRGILHRDLKPSNILVDRSGAPHVIDFGLAQRLGEVSGSIAETEPGQRRRAMGTLNYMSPEQAGVGQDAITTATDVYGLGTILYALLAGRPPVRGNVASEVIRQLTHSEIEPPHVHRPGVDRELEAICLKCLKRGPKDRYGSALELAEDLNRWIEGRPILARPASRVERAVKWARRRPEIAALSGAVVILALLGITGIIGHWLAAVAARDEALRSEDIARHAAYAARLNLADRDWSDANIAGVLRQLNATGPRADKADLRGFEWYYLDRLSRAWGRTLSGHKASVTRVAYSPDGHRLASASFDGTIKLWDAASGQVIRTIAVGKVVYAMAFHPDGTRLASSNDRDVTLWDTATGQAIHAFSGHTRGVYRVAFSPDGKLLASSSPDGTVRLWDVASAALLHILEDHRVSWFSGLAFSPDGKVLASGGGGEPTVRFWDVTSGKPARPPFKAAEGVFGDSTAFRSDGKIAASAAADGTITIWDVATGSPLRTIRDSQNRDTTRALAFSPDGQTLASVVSSRQAITLWDVAAGHLVTSIQGHTDSILGIAFSPDGLHLASASGDSTVRLWDLTRVQGPRSLRSKDTVRSVAFGPDGSYLASAGVDKVITIWDLSGERAARTLVGNNGQVTSVAISPDGRRAAAAGEDHSVRIWDVATGRAMPVLEGHTEAVHWLAFSPVGRSLASASNDRTIRLWDVDTGRATKVLRGHIGPVTAAAFSRDGQTLASAGADGFVLFWEIASGRQVRAIKAHPPHGIHAIALSPDGRWLATTGTGPELSIKVWDLDSGQPAHELQGHALLVNRLAFSADSKRLVSASSDRTVRIWDPVFGHELLVLRGHAGDVWDVAISPDGARIATAGGDATVRLWEAGVGSGLRPNR